MRLPELYLVVSGLSWAAVVAVAESISQGLVVHVGLVVFAAHLRAYDKVTADFDWIALPICLLGPVGVPAAVTTYLIRGHVTVSDKQREAWYDELQGRTSDIATRSLAADVSLGRVKPTPSSRLRPAIEILRHGSFRDRQRVLLWIARRKDPSLKPLLEHAMRCDDTIIRSQAASLIVHFRFSEQVAEYSAAATF